MHSFFDLTHFRELGQKYKNIFLRFLVQMKTSKFAFEINWPLVLTQSWERYEINTFLPPVSSGYLDSVRYQKLGQFKFRVITSLLTQMLLNANARRNIFFGHTRICIQVTTPCSGAISFKLGTCHFKPLNCLIMLRGRHSLFNCFVDHHLCCT